LKKKKPNPKEQKKKLRTSLNNSNRHTHARRSCDREITIIHVLYLEEILYEIKLIGKAIEISQIDHTISTHRDMRTFSMSTNDQNKETNYLARNPSKRSNLKPPQLQR